MNYDFSKSGFTLLEILLGLGIFVIVAGAVYFSYANVLQTILASQFNLNAISLAESEIEAVRNLPYEQVGVQGGAPAGALLSLKSVFLDNTEWTVRTIVRNIDDPFDGQIGGAPNDLAPADYKLVEIETACRNCGWAPVRLTARVAPQNLEGSSRNGSLFINVFDAFGQPLSGAEVLVVNNAVNPAINISDITGLNGALQLVDIATSSFAYEIAVSKSGYSAERTYPLGGAGNPNPVKPHATVAMQQVTSISFAIDRVSTVNLKTADQLCQPAGTVDFTQAGSKLIGTDPNVLKYSATLATDSGGQKMIDNLEWDTYNFKNIDSTFEIAGAFSPLSLVVDPNQTYNAQWLMEPKQPRSLLVTVKDDNGQLLPEASVTLTKTGFSAQQNTGHRLMTETDWSLGRYATQSGGLETENPTGEITLRSNGGKYASQSQEWLVSETIDFGTAETVFYRLSWQPANQPPGAGSDSLRMQLATNNDNATWNFVGPDGTASSFYALADTAIFAGQSGSRYLRYQVFMQTADELVTPVLEQVKVDFHSSCLPDGQSFFKELSGGTHTLTISKNGYQSLVDSNVNISSNWQEYSATLIANP